MTEFNPGDRVRLSPLATPSRQVDLGDTEGTVLRYSTIKSGGVLVQWDSGSTYWNCPPEREIELVSAAPTSTARDLRSRVDSLDAEISAESIALADRRELLAEQERDLQRKHTLLSQYRAVLADLTEDYS